MLRFRQFRSLNFSYIQMNKIRGLLLFNLVLCMCVFFAYLQTTFVDTGYAEGLGKIARYWDVIPQSFDVGSNATNGTDANSCNKKGPTRKSPVAVNLTVPNWDTLVAITRRLQAGGRFKPNCTGPDRVAIIVPYRGRENQLRMLLHNLHPFLQRQPIQYGLYVIELVPNVTFNRALLMNIGFVEASKRDDYQCFIFHDVDLLPEDNANLYTCPTMPRHMSVAVDKFNYKLPYASLFGGVSAITKEHFKKVNGYSNLFFGWGGEDDEMEIRLKNASLKLTRYSVEIARYKMIKHVHEKDNAANPQRLQAAELHILRYSVEIARYKMISHVRDKGNAENPERSNLILTARERLGKDGLNTMRNYSVVNVDDKSTLYTRILVNFTKADYGLK